MRCLVNVYLVRQLLLYYYYLIHLYCLTNVVVAVADAVDAVLLNLNYLNMVCHLWPELVQQLVVVNLQTVLKIICFSLICWKMCVFLIGHTWLCWFCSAIAFSLACLLHLYLWFWNQIFTWKQTNKVWLEVEQTKLKDYEKFPSMRNFFAKNYKSHKY